MASFTDFLNILPDPNNPIGYAGQAGSNVTSPDVSRVGPGYASVNLSSNEKIMKNRTNSGRYTSRSASSHFWKIDIKYNPMTSLEFNPIYSFLMQKRGGLLPFYVSLPQYVLPQDSTFAVNPYVDALSPTSIINSGETSVLLTNASYNYTTNNTPLPGDVFNISDSLDSNHDKTYMVTRVETEANYKTGTAISGTDSIRVWFSPGVQKEVSSSSDFIFTNCLFKVALANDVQSYSLGTNNLYQYSLSLEEVQ